MKQLVVIGVGAMILAACSSGGDAAPSTLSPATTAAATSTVPVTTMPASTSTTTSTTSTTSTTLAPTTTAATSTEDLIKQAVQGYFVAYEQCGQSPVNCEPASFTAAKGSTRSIIAELIAGMIEKGLQFSVDDRGSYLVAESVDVLSQDEATANYCAHDALVVLGPVGPDGQPTVVNDQIEDIRYQYRLYRENSEWRVGVQHEVERLPDGESCPSAQ